MFGIDAGGRVRTCVGTKPIGVFDKVEGLKAFRLSPPKPIPFGHSGTPATRFKN